MLPVYPSIKNSITLGKGLQQFRSRIQNFKLRHWLVCTCTSSSSVVNTLSLCLSYKIYSHDPSATSVVDGIRYVYHRGLDR